MIHSVQGFSSLEIVGSIRQRQARKCQQKVEEWLTAASWDPWRSEQGSRLHRPTQATIGRGHAWATFLHPPIGGRILESPKCRTSVLGVISFSSDYFRLFSWLHRSGIWTFHGQDT